jgi:hypothetical protein
MRYERLTDSHSERGAALLLTMMVIMTLSVMGVSVIISTATNKALSRNYEIATQAQNMAEIAVKVGYREFITAGFLQTTHTLDMDNPATGDDRISTSLDDYYIDVNGDFVWEWNDSKGYDPLWDTDIPHGFLFRVYYYTPTAFVIEGEGWYGEITRRVRAKGEVEGMFQFSYFASRDLGEFASGTSQTITGKVHANGNMYVRPSGSTLDVDTDAFTATGYIIRTRDAWGQPDSGGTCNISRGGEGGTMVEMEPDVDGPRGTDGSAFDSFNADWDDQTVGARATWGGVVRDKVPHKSPPPVANLESGEYYDDIAQAAGVKIDSNAHTTYSSWCTKVTTMWNWNEQRVQIVWDIDVDQMIDDGDWPTNNVIYSDVPVRISNAEELDDKLLFTSCQNVYTKGDFNTVDKKGASIMTLHRIYHLSDNWDDAQSTNSKNLAATDTQINGALVDGSPAVDEYNWCDVDEDHRYDSNSALIYNDWDNKTAAGFNLPVNPTNPWANCEDLLEDWTGMTLTKLGSMVHMNSSYDIMCPSLTNAGIDDDEIAWVRATGYAPPTHDFTYDPDLTTVDGQPPYTPMIGHITSWEPF